ncbi:geranylgeranyl reductase family protein [Candidatus Woesearchaeota archaeon]|nr:geranylgeranyl reductase family protein [Candidatus Woesearchaeota archaeon]
MISVIGAGPAGCYYASKEKGDVHIFEEHASVGNPIACTGILTDSVLQFTDIPKDLIISKINKFKMVAPNGKSLYVDLNKTNMVLHRAKFDQFVLQKALDNGAKLHLNEKFLGYRQNGTAYKLKTSKKTYDSEMIIGADGPHSAVAKAAGIYGKRKFVKGYQARCKVKDLEEGVTEVHLNLGEFSWVVPEDDKIARIGVIGVDDEKLKADYKKLIGNSEVLEDQSGIIPLYNPRQKIKKGNIFLLGDAATHVKASTYGGIIYGMIAGDYLAKNKGTFVSNINKKLSKDLWISLKMRNMMNAMNEKQANELIDIFEKKRNNKILSEYDRNFPSKFIVQLLMKEAKLWKLGFKIFANRALGK